jgi:cell wall-associated NlpC family hydrolase
MTTAMRPHAAADGASGGVGRFAPGRAGCYGAKLTARRRAKDCASPGAKEAIRLTPMRKATLAGLISLVVVLALAVTASAAPIKAKKEKLAAVQAELAQVREQSSIAVERYNEATTRLEDVQGRIIRNRKLLKIAEYKLGVANDHLTSRARQVYKADSAGILDVVFASSTFDDLLTQLDVMQRMAESDAQTARTARAYRQEVADRRLALEEDRKAAVELVARREESKDQVLALEAQLETTAGGLKDEIAELEAAAARRAEQAAARALAAQQDSSSNGSSSGSSSGGGGGGTVIDPGGTGRSAVVAIAQRYLGVPYVWGGASPRGFDCSGLAMYCYAQIGIGMSHGATDQQRQSKPVSISALQPGDLVFFGSASYSHHVGIYVGGGQMIHAPHTGAVVSYGSISGAWIGGRF